MAKAEGDRNKVRQESRKHGLERKARISMQRKVETHGVIKTMCVSLQRVKWPLGLL